MAELNVSRRAPHQESELDLISIDELTEKIGEKDAIRISMHQKEEYGREIEDILFNMRGPTGKLDKRSSVDIYWENNGANVSKMVGDYIIFFDGEILYNNALESSEFKDQLYTSI